MTTVLARTRPRGFAPWSPHKSSLALIEDVRGILADYQAHLPLTARQVYYRLVATCGFAKTAKAYSSLCEKLNRARRAGLIPFSAIRDDGVTRFDATAWADEADFIADMRGMAETFRLDRQDGQPVRLWVLCESAGMAPMLARVASPYSVPVLTSGGFDSVTAKHALAEELSRAARAGQPLELLHIGDRDPSGEHVFSSLSEDVAAFCGGMADIKPRFTRLAVTEEQIEELRLPTAPPNPKDRRRFTGETVQCEAVPPDTLTSILRDAITARRDPAQADAVLDRERDIREALLARIEGSA